VTAAVDYAEAVQRVLAAALRDSGHGPCEQYGRPMLQTDSDGTQLAVCPCGMVTEIPGGVEAQMQTRGFAPDSPPAAASDPVQPGLPLIDPSQITTPDELNAHLLDVVARLESGQLFERQCIEAEYEAKLAWELAKAEQVAKGGGAEDVRTARALTEHGDLYRKAQLAEMMRKATQAAMHNLRSVLSGYQSVSKSVLSTYGAGGSPGPATSRGRY